MLSYYITSIIEIKTGSPFTKCYVRQGPKHKETDEYDI
jgi:hypothetical protein